MKDKIISVAVPRPLDSLFTYRLSAEQAAQVRVGSWVKVPFGRAQVHAFVAGEPREAETLEGSITYEELKSIVEVGPPESAIPAEVFELCRWTHDYYHSPLGEVLNAAMPASALGLRSARRGARQIRETTRARVTPHALTEMQQEAFQALESLRTSTHEQAKPPRVALLHGVTGSGKTEIYIHLITNYLEQGKQCLLMLPEIAISVQMVSRLKQIFGEDLGVCLRSLGGEFH
jgi:primosomal protein N' (replication factor Y)